MPPSVDSPFPNWMHAERHRRRITLSASPYDFWQNISKDKLKDEGFDEKLVCINQREFVAERVLMTSQGKTIIPHDEYSLLFVHAPIDALSDAMQTALDILLCTLSKGKRRIRKVQVLPSEPIDAEVVFCRPTCPILKAFVTYPIGQLAVKLYKKGPVVRPRFIKISRVLYQEGGPLMDARVWVWARRVWVCGFAQDARLAPRKKSPRSRGTIGTNDCE